MRRSDLKTIAKSIDDNLIAMEVKVERVHDMLYSLTLPDDDSDEEEDVEDCDTDEGCSAMAA